VYVLEASRVVELSSNSYGRVSRRPESIGLLGLIGALVAYGSYRIVEWAHFLSAHASGHRSDFAEYYLTASIGQRFGWSALYSDPARVEVANTIRPPIKAFPIDVPPMVGWVVRPFTELSLDTAYWIWVSGLIAAFLATWWLVTGGPFLHRLVFLIAPLTLFPVAFGITLGQVVGFELLGVAVCYACLSRHWDVWAGLALSPLLLHPQCFLLVPLILVPLGRWRAVLGFIVAAAVQSVLSLAVLGTPGVRSLLHALNYVQAHRIDIWTTLSVPLAVHNRVVSDGGSAVIVVAVLFVARWNRGDIRTALGASVIGSLLVAPFIHIQDEMSIVIAAWLLLAGRRSAPNLLWSVTAFGVMAVDVPSTKFSWGYLLMGLEGVWLATLLIQSLGRPRWAGKHFARSGRPRPDLSLVDVEPVGAHYFLDHRYDHLGGLVPRRAPSLPELFWQRRRPFVGGFGARPLHL
jgi:hypothetical protein